jgi:mono/diheme cytochrome c family protein
VNAHTVVPPPRLRRASTVGVVLCAASVAVVSYAQQGSPTGSRSVWDRVYTDVQATRGEELYGRHCVECHGSGLDGDAVSEIPALAGDPFMQRWSTRSVDDLVAHMQRSMPPSAPGSLTRPQYVDLAAHLLKANGFPSGFDALGTDSERLRQIVIQRTPR